LRRIQDLPDLSADRLHSLDLRVLQSGIPVLDDGRIQNQLPRLVLGHQGQQLLGVVQERAIDGGFRLQLGVIDVKRLQALLAGDRLFLPVGAWTSPCAESLEGFRLRGQVTSDPIQRVSAFREGLE
jgi:hypothetical protein